MERACYICERKNLKISGVARGQIMRSSVAASGAQTIDAKRLDLQSYLVFDVTRTTIVAPV